MKPEELRKMAQAYALAAELRREWLVSGFTEGVDTMRKTMRKVAQVAFDAGITLPEFLDAIAQYEDENKN